jgi:hypothetical protein
MKIPGIAVIGFLLIPWSGTHAQMTNEWPKEGDSVYISVDLVRSPDESSDCWAWTPRCNAVTVASSDPARMRWLVKWHNETFALEGNWSPTFYPDERRCDDAALKGDAPEPSYDTGVLWIKETSAPADRSHPWGGTSSACGFYLAPPLSGWVVYHPSQGMQVPVPDVRFSRGSGWIVRRSVSGPQSPEDIDWLKMKKRCSPPDSLEPLPITVGSDGYFSHGLDISTSTTTWRRGSTERHEAWDEDVVVLLQAEGCDDLLVHFTSGWKERTLVMSCPRRIVKN